MKNKIIAQKLRRQKRTRSKIVRKTDLIRLSVHRSNNHIYVQAFDDVKNHTVASASDISLKGKKMNNVQKAQEVGTMIADKLVQLKITQVVFDRGSFKYGGRVKALAEAVRAKGVTI